MHTLEGYGEMSISFSLRNGQYWQVLVFNTFTGGDDSGMAFLYHKLVLLVSFPPRGISKAEQEDKLIDSFKGMLKQTT